MIANDFLNEKPGVAKKILRALVKAETFVAGNAEKSQEIVARFLGTSAAEIAAIWPEFTPRVSLEQSLLLRLEDIGRWAVRRQLVETRQIPNFLQFIHFEALQTVNPHAITVVR